MDISERKVAEEAIWRSEAYLAESQKLSHTGSFGWKVSSGEIFWSDETFRIFACDLKTKPTLEFVLSRVHPDDHELVRQIDRASRDGEGFALEHRLQLPGGSTVSPYPIPRSALWALAPEFSLAAKESGSARIATWKQMCAIVRVQSR